MLFLQLAISAIAQSCICGLVAAGLVLIYRAHGLTSLAQGEPMAQGFFSLLMAAVVLLLPTSVSAAMAGLGGTWIAPQSVVIGVTATLGAMFYALLRYSRYGLAMRAASQNPRAAYSVGISVPRLKGLSWGLATALAIVAGLLQGPDTAVNSGMGWVGLKALPAAALGGFDDLSAALRASVLLGLTESLSGNYLSANMRELSVGALALTLLAIGLLRLHTRHLTRQAPGDTP